jgi:hypothetical protein
LLNICDVEFNDVNIKKSGSNFSLSKEQYDDMVMRIEEIKKTITKIQKRTNPKRFC